MEGAKSMENKRNQNGRKTKEMIPGHEQWVMRTRKISFIVVFLGFLGYLAATLTPYWIAYKDNGYSMNIGIFFSCISLNGKTTCGTSGGATEGLLLAAQIFSPLALLAIFTATCCGMMVFYWPEVHRRRLLRVACVTSFLSAVFIVLTVALYMTYYRDRASNLHAAFFLCVLGLICSPIAGVLFLQDSITMILVEVRKKGDNSGYGDKNRLIVDDINKKFGSENQGSNPPLKSFIQHPPISGYQPIFKGDRLLRKKMEADESYRRPITRRETPNGNSGNRPLSANFGDITVIETPELSDSHWRIDDPLFKKKRKQTLSIIDNDAAF